MASKENQEALKNIKNIDWYGFYKKDFDTLQQAIDRLELVEKALDKACKKLEEYTLTMYDEGINFKPCIMNEKLWKGYLLQEKGQVKMTNCEIFPIKIEDYITYHKFEDSEEIYTNGAELITVYDIEKALKYYDYENKIEKLEKALDKACEYLANVETDGCYYCPYDIKKQKCEFNCEDKESIRQFLLSEMEKQ